MVFFSRYAPPTCKQVKAALKKLGFTPRAQNSTSHEHFVKTVDGVLYKVTVDCPKAPFSDILVKSMAAQAGMTKKDFLHACHAKK